MKTLLEILRLSTDYLRERGCDHPRREAEWLLCDAFGLQRIELYLEHDRPLNEVELARCRQWLQRRGSGEPLQYIRGYVDFYGCRLHVDERVLIPRQETELLVDMAAKLLSTESLDGKVFWDLCCGSGCVGIAIKKRFPMLHVVGSDLSPAALELAADNAASNGVIVEWVEGDLCEAFSGRMPADYCLCNPPYIASGELPALSREVAEYEPLLALDGGDDGLAIYRRLVGDLPRCLHSGAKVWFEIGASQGPSVVALFSKAPWSSCRLQPDLARHDRFIFLVNE